MAISFPHFETWFVSASVQLKRTSIYVICRATNWAKLSATATLGVIHRGHEQEGVSVPDAELPSQGQCWHQVAPLFVMDIRISITISPLFVTVIFISITIFQLRLIHANHGQDITEYLLGQVLHLQLNISEI